METLEQQYEYIKSKGYVIDTRNIARPILIRSGGVWAKAFNNIKEAMDYALEEIKKVS